MSGLRVLRVAGVPEHFNSPFHIAISRSLYRALGFDLQWQTVKEGTGAMLEKLEKNEVDVAVLLTEGAVARACGEKRGVKIAGTYVESPLRWGIHTLNEGQGGGKEGEGIETLKGKTFGVSRELSGSHLMAHVLATQKGWRPKEDAPIKVVGGLEKAREAMREGQIDAWLWEKFTTKHLVDSGEWAIVGEIPTPWPAFVFAVHSEQLEKTHFIDDLSAFISATRQICDEFKNNVDGATIRYLGENFGMSVEDAQEWLDGTRWCCAPYFSYKSMLQAQEALKKIGQLSGSTDPGDILAKPPCSLVE